MDLPPFLSQDKSFRCILFIKNVHVDCVISSLLRLYATNTHRIIFIPYCTLHRSFSLDFCLTALFHLKLERRELSHFIINILQFYNYIESIQIWLKSECWRAIFELLFTFIWTRSLFPPLINSPLRVIFRTKAFASELWEQRRSWSAGLHSLPRVGLSHKSEYGL